MVGVLGLTLDEVREAAAACTYVSVPDPPPGYLQPFLVERLADSNPGLAAKVAGLDTWQFEELFAVIRALQRQDRSTHKDLRGA
jgi:hypothetical protein